MKNIIVRTPNFIGDTVNMTPAIELLKQEYPEAVFTMVGPDFIDDLFKHDPRIVACISFKKGHRNDRKLLRKIRQKKYDLGVIFINTFVSALLFRLARIKTVIGYQNEGRGFLLDFKIRLNRNVHYINRYAILVNDYLNKKYTYLPPLTLFYTEEPTFQFDNQLKTIGFYPGGNNKSFRKYPEEYAIELLQQLKNYNIVLIGDGNDHLTHKTYQEKSGHPHLLDLSGKTSIESFVNTIARLDLLITIDSAAMHIAAATRTPFIALLGLSTSPTSCITPKVKFGKTIKIENGLIDEAEYIKNISPEIVLKQVEDCFR